MRDDELIDYAYAQELINWLEYNVLKYRFDEAMTYREVAEALNISTGRAYQIKEKAFRVLRDTGCAATIEKEARPDSRLRRALMGEKRV